MKDLRQIWNRLRKNLAPLLCAQLFCWMAGMIVLERIGSSAARAVLSYMGYSYLTAENYMDFASHPLAILVLVCAAAVVLAFLLFELAIGIRAGLYGYQRTPRGVFQIILDGFGSIRDLVRRSGAAWPVWLLAAGLSGLFVCGHFLYYIVMNMKFVRYALQRMWTGGRGYVVLLAGGLIAAGLLSIFVLPAAMTGRTGVKDSFLKSFRLTIRHFPKIAGGLILCNGLLSVCFLILYYLAMTGAAGIVWFLRPPSAVMATLYVLDDHIRLAGGLAAGVVGMGINGQMILALYLRFSPGEAAEGMLGIRPGRPKKTVWLFSLLLALEAGYLYNTAAHVTLLTENMYGGTFITAHRGGAGAAPENTLAALKNAIENAADYAEIDVQETSDGVLILLHDNDFARTTGTYGKVWETDYAQVRQMDAGSRYSSEYAGEPVPTLEEALELCQGRLDLNIELKSNGHNEDIVEKAVQLIESMGMTGQCVITSANYRYLEQVKELNEDIRTGYIINMVYGRAERLEHADFLSVSFDCITEEFVRRAHEAGKEIHAWTVNSRKDMRKMIEAGVDNLITDRPSVAREVLEEDGGSLGFLEALGFLWG